MGIIKRGLILVIAMGKQFYIYLWKIYILREEQVLLNGTKEICGGTHDKENGIFVNEVGTSMPAVISMKKFVFFFKDKVLNIVRDTSV